MSLNAKENGNLKKLANFGMDALETIITKLFKNADEQSFPLPSDSAEGLNLLKNVEIESPVDGQGLVYDGTSHTWKNINIPICDKTTQGTYTLQATVDSSGNVTYSWV